MRTLLLGMAIQAFITAVLSFANVIQLNAWQQLLVGILYLAVVVLMLVARVGE